ncbi:hypothetical protein SAMN04515667_1469 [Formosa sp. Hel1_31_208]|uniref:DUF5723 family protein n=1 Tax=Formosa sp. Hel1_31_208 TaxID=1798225 RepID=UPI00087BBEF2|nr:DUF5723 family protein [Formosa sp. Hel1_31_208]SDS12644.1 hypothetical protein SAMN04515667_1469 [Formosa sp. Hel1_31_208]
MKSFQFLVLLLLLCFINTSNGQSYIGHTVDNYSGILGVTSNPANVVGSNFRADINLFSVSTFGGSDYFGINVSDILGGDGFDIENDSERFPSNTNNFFLNADVVGPSFMFNINKKSSIGIITRGRAFVNINDINGELFETIEDEFESEDDFDFNSTNLSGTIHVWSEIGLAYGRQVMNKPKHILNAGVTLKYLQGAGGIFINSPGLEGQYTAVSESLTTKGTLNYGSTNDFDEDDLDFGNLTSGIGLDIGVTYQWHPNRENDSIPSYRDPYKLKIGLAITDIGSINYQDTEIKSYDLNNTVDTSTYEDDVEEFLDNNYNNTTVTQETKLQLPTALRLLVDYRLSKKWLVSAQANLSMVKKGNELNNSIINSFTIAPRLETKWFSFYAPLSLRQYGDFAFGGGLRLGPLTVGSGSVFSNLLSDSSKTTDIFVGLNIPIYRK